MADDDGFSFDPQPPVPATPPDESNPGKYVVWGWKQLVLGFFAVFILFVVLDAAIIVPVQAATGENSSATLAAQAVTSALWDGSILLVIYWVVRRNGGSWRNLGFRRPRPRPNGEPWTPGRLIFFILGAYLVAIFTVSAYSQIVSALGLHALEPGKQLPNGFFNHGYLSVLIGFAVVIAAPVAEEVFFRGFLFAGLRKHLPFIFAALISGVIFSLAHGDPGLIIPFTLVGMILAYTYERTGSLFTDISVHFIFNAVSFSLILLFPDARK